MDSGCECKGTLDRGSYIDFWTKAIRLQNPQAYIHEGRIAHKGNQEELCTCVSLMKTAAPPLNCSATLGPVSWVVPIKTSSRSHLLLTA